VLFLSAEIRISCTTDGGWAVFKKCCMKNVDEHETFEYENCNIGTSPTEKCMGKYEYIRVHLPTNLKTMATAYNAMHRKSPFNKIL
jgi:hypothetical protein